jgi:hypothetical protein
VAGPRTRSVVAAPARDRALYDTWKRETNNQRTLTFKRGFQYAKNNRDSKGLQAAQHLERLRASERQPAWPRPHRTQR